MNQPTGFCCNMHAMTVTERARYNVLREQLAAAVQQIAELPDGYAFRLHGERISIVELAEWVSYERKCCPFFELTIEAPKENAPISLNVIGSAGIKDFIRAEFGALPLR